MEQKDYLMREIEKVTQLLMELIRKVSGLTTTNFEYDIKQIDDILITQFDLSLDDIISFDKSKFKERLNTFDKVNIELFAELLSKIINKINEVGANKEYNAKELIKKTIILIEYIDAESKTFSMKRKSLKDRLQELNIEQ